MQKNYFLHQSAKDAYRSYLQAYASYSLKRIFDVNALDLAKVGKAFGFAIPPRVNINMGGGKGSTGRNGKRRREDNEEEEHIVDEEDGGGDGVEDAPMRSEMKWRESKGRRIEALGRKRVKKEIYKKGKDRQKMASSSQWSR